MFLGIIVLFVIAIFVYAPLKKYEASKGIIEIPEIRNVITPDKEHTGAFAKTLNKIEAFKVWVNDTYINYLPMYVSIVSSTQTLKNNINTPTYTMLSNLADAARNQPQVVYGRTETEADTNSTENNEKISFDAMKESNSILKISFMKQYKNWRDYKYKLTTSNGTEYTFLDRALAMSVPSMDRQTEEFTKDFNRWASLDTDVNFYVYLGTRLQDTALSKIYFPDEYSNEKQFEYILENLNNRIQTDYMVIESIEDRLEKLFYCDHHWTAKGADEGYRQIVAMMQKNYDNFGDAVTPVAYHTLEDIHYCGSFSVSTGDYSLSDTFSWYDYGLPYHEISGAAGIAVMQEQYLAGNYPNSQNSAIFHYENFYGEANYICYPENNTGRNLLVICDSFAKALAEPLASHFDKSYFIYPWGIGEGINYKQFLEENNITDVLVIATTCRIFADVWEDTPWERIG